MLIINSTVAEFDMDKRLKHWFYSSCLFVCEPLSSLRMLLLINVDIMVVILDLMHIHIFHCQSENFILV